MGNGEFNPEGLVNKEQLATFLVRGLGMEEKVELSPIGLLDMSRRRSI
ncbi:hypothetical protein AB4Z50_14040 [Paenibacillus sp. 2TAB26]